MKPLLLFQSSLYSDDSLIEGRLLLIDIEKVVIYDKYVVCSGHPGKQTLADCSEYGGAIPECLSVRIEHYTVTTDPLSEPDVEGIKGNFFAISPTEVTIEGNVRGDWGLHFDADYPGTLGCLGFKNPQPWQAFQNLMEDFKKAGIKEVPLLINYSQE